MKKHYKTLGLKDGASQEEIQTTYERLSKELDPKKNDNQEFFVEEYKKVQEAYEALSNSSILATQGGAHKNDLDQLTPSKKMDIPTQVTKNRFTFLINRKRNIITFIVLVIILKLVLHFSLFPETEQIVNIDKKVYISNLKYTRAQNRHNALISYNSYPNVTRSEKDARLKKYKNSSKYDYVDLIKHPDTGRTFYYPKELKSLSFKTHLQQIFRDKLYLFFISILTLSLVVFLFNDKIKAR
jgi:hypothetical protein